MGPQHTHKCVIMVLMFVQAGFLLRTNEDTGLQDGVILSDDHGACWEERLGSLPEYLNTLLVRSFVRAQGSGPGRGPKIPVRSLGANWSKPHQLGSMFKKCTKKGGGEDGYVDFLKAE